MSKRRVVVTGLGVVSPLGSTVDSAWAALLRGESGIAPITRFDVSAFATRFGGAVRGFDVSQYMAPKEARRMDEFMQYGVAAGIQAVTDSGADFAKLDVERCGVISGAGIGGLATIEAEHGAYLEAKNPRKISPFFIPSSIINMISGHLSIRYGLKGPNLGVVTACTTSTHAIGLGMRAIQYGDADLMVTGGAEMSTTHCGVGGFSQAKALSQRNDAPEKASRPWDRDRDGFVMADGGGALVIEELEHARARGARIYAELIGFGMSGDAHHITAPPEDGEGARIAMSNALRDAAIAPDAVQYLNAHATSTMLGDKAETTAIKRAFGEHAYRLAISSTKSMTGHLLGAAGVVEALFSVLAIRDQVAPPTINLDNPDPDCDLDYVPNTARSMPIDVALSNSFGFGGTNGTLILRRFSG
ncbi:MAG: beta-ketoacyl-ACP synthase II [Sinobacteraceae bacterium]|nr:beta-ketoacyl-ACP synthase II [Nevskiaceae bacterium]MCP5339163.1 beta-ketoacyl-ACP synthase II [Nevskiaceae bacterium]MCP5360465.1 beta-ketoacyl-ACP synthase II [Nevskiaceae bacterium]MCP5467002.1 beta-ketoacyl-ACP synthase II [Nevskiaceae bacterium]MCP5472108.1 beta-ketoacyl-ACP synthase II [Nevskiaceae bacterium]